MRNSGSPQPPLRLVYTGGPGDIIGSFRHWRAGQEDPTQVAMTYSGQFYSVCRELGAHAYVIGSHPRRETLADGQFYIQHRPAVLADAKGALSHLAHLWRSVRLGATAIRFRADAVIVGDGACHWFPLRLLPKLGIAVIPTIHCVFWGKNADRPSRVQRFVRWLDRPLWRCSASRILSASGDITAQLERLAGRARPVIEFLPTYRQGTFPAIEPPRQPPFRVLFAGRIEANKGVFDLFEIARRFRNAGRNEIVFELCGTGSALEHLRREVAAAGLSDRFIMHGHCDRLTMRKMFENCHAVIVPTTTGFVEGFNQVVVEGVLSGRPVITSAVCPALEYVRDAVVEVPPDDVGAYQAALEQLVDDVVFYERKRSACPQLQAQFYDPARGWGAALRKALEALPS